MTPYEAALLATIASGLAHVGIGLAAFRMAWRARARALAVIALASLNVFGIAAIVLRPPTVISEAEAAAREERRKTAHEGELAVAEAERLDRAREADRRARNAAAEQRAKDEAAEQERKVATASAEAARAPKPTNSDAIGCRSRDTYQRLATIAASGDKMASAKLIQQLVATAECRIIDAGTRVYLEDTALFSGLLCGRPAGETACYWLPITITK